MNKTLIHKPSATFSRSFTHLRLSPPSASTFRVDHIRLDAVILRVVFMREDDFIATHYDLVPKRTLDDFLRSHEIDMARRPRKKYVDIDLPMVEDDEGD